MHCKNITITAQGHSTTNFACFSRLQLLFLVLMSTPPMQGCGTVHMDQVLLYCKFVGPFLLFPMFLLLLVYFIAIHLFGTFTFTFSLVIIFIMDEFGFDALRNSNGNLHVLPSYEISFASYFHFPNYIYHSPFHLLL